MQFEGKGFKRVIQSSTPYSNTAQEDIRTSTYQSRSPEPHQTNEKRSPYHQMGSMESGFGEMLYVEPNEINFRRSGMMSPLPTETHHSRARSPTINLGQSVLSVVRNDLEKADYTYAYKRAIPPMNLEKMEKNTKRIVRSPKTINIGESPQEVEYNLRTLNAGRRSPTNLSKATTLSNYIQQPSTTNQYQSYQSYINMPSNEPGNIFLDQPMVQTNYMQPGEQPLYMNSPIPIRGNSDYLNSNSREIQYTMNPRDLREPTTNFNGFNGKMSPTKNVDDESVSDKNDNPTAQLKDLKRQMEREENVVRPDLDGMVEGNGQNEIEKIEEYNTNRPNQEIQENMTEAEIKKLVKQMTKGYDPQRGGEGRLISTSQMVIPSSNEDLFSERYKVLKKMNKLSSILLSKNRVNEYDTGSLERSFEEQKKTFNTKTLKTTNIKNQRIRNRSPQNKFLYLSLAMLASKGPSAEDRIILRKMRFDKGGVVDLAQETLQKKNQFKIKKLTKGRGRFTNAINPKYREKAAQVVQGWWRGLKQRYQKILQQIIKIQSVWRGRWLRKYIYDIIYLSCLHQRFCEILERNLVNHVRPYVWQKLFGEKKWAKEALANLLIEKDRRFSILRARTIFDKWYNIINLMNKKMNKGRGLVEIRKKDHSRKTILKKYLNDWALRANLLKYMKQSQDQEGQKKKFFGALDIINGMNKLSKRNALNSSKEQLKEFLMDIIKKRKLKKVFKKTLRYKNYLLKLALLKWKDTLSKFQMKDLKHDIFGNMYGRVHSRMDKIKMKKYLEKWKNIVPKKSKLPDYLKAAELLERFCQRSTYQDPLDAIKETIKYDNNNKGIHKIYQLKQRYLNRKLRDYLQKWKNQSIKANAKEKYDKLYKALLLGLHNKLKTRILQKRFNQWRQRPKIDINGIYNKNKLLVNILENISKQLIKPDKEYFLKNLNKTKAPRAYKKVGGKILSKYINKDKNLLRHYFFKWRGKTRDLAIKDLKAKLLKFLYLTNQERNKRNILSQFLSRWKLFISEGQYYDNIDKLRKVREGFEKIQKLYTNRAFEIMMRLYRKMNKDFRPKYLLSLAKRLVKPRMTLRDCLNRWRRINDIEKSNKNIQILKGRILKGNAGRIKERNKRDLLIKAFYKWRAECKKPEEYYPKILNGLNIISHLFKNKLCKKPFENIKKSKNYKRRLIPLLKKKRHSQKRFNKDILKNTLNKWRNQVKKSDIKDLKSNFVFKTKKGYLKNQKDKILMKYLTRWKLYRRKGLDFKFTKGLNLIDNYAKKPFRKLILQAFKNKVYKISKNKGLKSVVKTGNSFKRNILRKALIQWWKKSTLTDPNKGKKIKYRLRRLFREKERKPLFKYFNKWKSQLKKSQLKQKDLEKAKKIVGNTLRNNDKLNLNYALSLWKKKIQQIREQYLKSLLVKQIKNSQNLKEKATMQSKLHQALLRWRSNIVPVNYYDIMKKIKRGCRLLKKGLKKRDEGKIYKGIKEKARYNRMVFLLKRMVTKTKPRVELNDKRKAFNIWYSKLGDTNRMKNKIKKLLDDYFLTKKINDSIYEEPKNIIVESIKNYDNLKKEKGQNLVDFVRGALIGKRTIKRMKISLFLNKKLRLKHKNLVEKAREILIRYHRKAQKIKNNKNAHVIQHFLKARLRRPEEKRQRIVKGANLIDKITKKKIWKNIWIKGKKEKMKKILLKHINQQDLINNKQLRNSLTKWRNIIPLLNQHDSVTMIANNYRASKARQKLKDLKKRLYLLKKNLYRYQDERDKITKMYLNKWVRINAMLRNHANMRIIQEYLKENLEIYRRNQAQDKLRVVFRKKLLRNLDSLMKKSSRIIGGKGEALYKTFEDIYYKRPYNTLINALKWIGRIKAIKKIQPKIKNALNKYYLPKTMEKWYNNTYKVMVNKRELIQKWLKIKHKMKKEKDSQRRQFLLDKIVNKLIHDTQLKVKIPFDIWNKKVYLSKVTKAAIKIQNAVRNYFGKIEGDKIESMRNLKELFTNNIIRQISDIVVESSRYLNPIREGIINIGSQLEKRFATNDLIESTNNLLKVRYLQSLMSKRSYTDAISALKRYLNKWKQYNSFSQRCANKIQNNYRSYKARQKRYRLETINDLLYKYFNKKDKTETKRKIMTITKWNTKARLIGCNINANKIKKFLKTKLMKKYNKRFKNFFIENSKKLTNHKINGIIKFNLLKIYLRKKNGKSLINKLKNNKRGQQIKNIILKRFYNLDSQLKQMYLANYLNQWKNQKNIINDYRFKMFRTIQNFWRKILAEKELKRLRGIRDKLKRSFIRKENNNQNKKRLAIKKWMNNAKIIKYTNSSQVIQDFMADIKRKIQKKNEMLRQLKIQKGLTKIFNHPFNSKYVFDKILSERNRNIFENFNNTLIKKREDLLKEIFKIIKENAKNNLLNKIFNIPNNLRNRILKKFTNKWKNNADKISKKQAAERIQRNFKIYLNRINKNKREDRMKNILTRLINYRSNIKNIYFQRWKKNVEKIKFKRASQRIHRYINKRYKIVQARSNWKKLSQQYYLNNRNSNISNLIDKLKKIIAIKKLVKPIIKRSQKNILSSLKNISRNNKIGKIMKLIVRKYQDKDDNLRLFFTLNKWYDVILKIKERENIFNKALKCIDKKDKMNAINIYYNVCLMKKLLHDIPRARLIDFFNKLKKNAEIKKKFENLSSAMTKTKTNILLQNKEQLVKKIYKLYAFNKLDNMFQKLNKALTKDIKKQFFNDLINKLNKNLAEKSEYTTKGQQSSSHQSPSIRLLFKGKSTKKNNNINQDKLSPIKRVIPFFVTYLEKKIKQNKSITFNKLRKHYLFTRFCKLYKTHSNKQMIHPKQNLLNKIKEKSEYNSSQGIILLKLHSLLQKYYIHHISTSLLEANRIYKILYVMRMIRMHKKISKLRFLREIIRKWRFSSFVKKMARKKMELMYKNLHASYLQMANEVFGDEDDVNPSIIKEFERFGNNLGMFNNEEPGDLDNKGYYQKVSKKYIFGTSVVQDNGESKDDSIQKENGQVSPYKNEESLNGSIDWLAKYKTH